MTSLPPLTLQLLLILVVLSLTVILVLIGVQFIKILQELRRSLRRLNQILADAKTISRSIAEPVEAASDFVLGLKKGFKIVDLLDRLISRKTKSSD